MSTNHNAERKVSDLGQSATTLNDASLGALAALYDAASALHDATHEHAFNMDGDPMPFTKAYRAHRLAEKVMTKAAKLMMGEF